jgi:hypothetical protein
MIQDLRRILTQYANHEIGAEALEVWIVSHMQQILDSRDKLALDIAQSLDALFVEWGEGLLTEDEFLEVIETANRKARTEVRLEPCALETGSRSDTRSGAVVSASTPADVRLVWAA